MTVLYAGSLVTPMEGPIRAALRARGLNLQGEPGGSKKLANFILAGVRSPDAFISADPAIVTALGGRVASSVAFARTSLGIAWSRRSPFARVLDRVAAGKLPLIDALATPGLRIGRTDPLLDPKGVDTVEAFEALAGSSAERRLLGSDENPDQIFPEEDLLARIETGQIDVGFFYRTEAIARNLPFVPLPPVRDSTATYTLAIMKDAPHPANARVFADFLLGDGGRKLLERAGLQYLKPVTPADNR
ncbi:MAG TPA: extracellular solute-binding protein [Candidatus Baltobacteraceae bacterium]|nr:extracellular solute-binding protein [Candidatus Baltobacteraceae bacterium]